MLQCRNSSRIESRLPFILYLPVLFSKHDLGVKSTEGLKRVGILSHVDHLKTNSEPTSET